MQLAVVGQTVGRLEPWQKRASACVPAFDERSLDSSQGDKFSKDSARLRNLLEKPPRSYVVVMVLLPAQTRSDPCRAYIPSRDCS